MYRKIMGTNTANAENSAPNVVERKKIDGIGSIKTWSVTVYLVLACGRSA